MSGYLRRIRMTRYGSYADREIGPFGSGLNVVCGSNETGKTTLASFIGGVLFGWEEGRGVNNTYRSSDGSREGWLEFSFDGEGDRDAEQVRVERGERVASRVERVADDVDEATWRSLFSLRADDLRTLRAAPDMASRLATAGSGSQVSPADAFLEIEQRIAAHTSRARDAACSAVRLDELLEGKRAQIKAATEQVELWKQEDRELAELADSRLAVSRRIAQLDDEIADLSSGKERIGALDENAARLESELLEIEAEIASASSREFSGHRKSARDELAQSQTRLAFDERLLDMDASEERIVLDRLDELSEEQDKLRRQLDRSKENSAASSASYEALLELDASTSATRRSKSWTVQAAVSVVSPVAFIATGIPLFVHGYQIASLSFTALGFGLVVLALFLAAAALVVWLRPTRSSDALESRQKDAQWVMLQDKKKLAASLEEMAEFDGRLRAYFESTGLAAADGSIRQARALLEGARERRALIATNEQRFASLEMRRLEVKGALADKERERRQIEESFGVMRQASPREFEALLRNSIEQRDALQEAARNMSQRIGELTVELDRARHDRALDRLKLEYQQLRCRLRESKHELVVLLLAKRMLERSIAVWENHGQPEVYAQANRLFSMMTDGSWTSIDVAPDTGIVATDANGLQLEVRHLSLGTCQQLYLALRIALLMTADSVGRNLPVLADDVLVNFDAARRAGAARALAELARTRQVIVFTCHEETRQVLASVPGAHVIDLDGR